MDYYQGVVVDYLRADRAVFVNTECCIQLNKGANPDTSGPHWYCDAVAVDFRNKEVFLCEISYEKKLGALIDRLQDWSKHWEPLHEALVGECEIPAEWPVRPWLFVNEESVGRLVSKLEIMKNTNGTFSPRITTLESVQPWRYRSWDHQDSETQKPQIPDAMRI